MPLKFAFMSFCTAIANIGRFENGKTMLFLIIRAGLVAGFSASTTVQAEFFATGLADIPVMSTRPAMQAWIECFLLQDREVSFDFFRNRKGILPGDQPDIFEGKAICKG